MTAYDHERVERWLLAISQGLPHGPAEPIGGRSTRPGARTAAEAGGLLAGCPERAAAVAMYVYGFDRLRKEAYYAILAEARAQARTLRRYYGPVETDDELRELAALVLEEQLIAPMRRTRVLRANWMGVTPGVWRRTYDRAHRALSAEVEVWLSTAQRAISRNLTDFSVKNSC